MPNGLEAKPKTKDPEPKSRYRSKTYWLAGLVAFLGAAGQLPQAQALLDELPPIWGTIAAFILAGLMAITREYTDRAIKGRLFGRSPKVGRSN